MAAAVGAGALAGCSAGPSDAAHYRQALAVDEDFATAWATCASIGDLGDRGDCQAAVTERFDRRAPADCEGITHELWKDECRFLLAERLGRAGDLDGALEACVSSRFRRHCTWHLIEDAVEASLERSDAEAEGELDRFYARKAMPDAAFQFWRVRHRLKNAQGQTLDEADCTGLRFAADCQRALHLHVQTMLDELARNGAQAVCARPQGHRVMLAGGPAFADGELVRHSEEEWVRRRCAEGAATP